MQCIRIEDYLQSSIEKGLMERVNQYFKDRIENFDDYYPCTTRNECNYFMYITGYNSLFRCTTIQYLRENYLVNELNERGEVVLS